MKNHNGKMNVRTLPVAVQAALVAMAGVAAPALAADDEVAALTRPTGVVEIGAANVSHSSAKFGEYSGLNESGGVLIGNVSVRGGDSYGTDPGVTRWSINGSDLGTTSRELGAAIARQGQWKINVGYDELRHNISDTYRTPQQGSMGGNGFVLPAGYGTYNAQAAPSTRGLNATQLAAFHTEKVGTTRKNTSISAGFNFNSQLSLQFDYNHLAQSGAKLIGFGAQGGQAATAPSAGTWRPEAVSILMNPTNYKTDNVSLNLNWAGEQGHLTGGYYGSTFRDGYSSVSWQNAGLNTAGIVLCPSGGANCTYQTNTASTMPGNQLHQLNLSGGYAFSSATKLAGGLSYGRNTQNDSFLTNGMWGALPKASLNGLVVTKHADLKLSHQATKELALSAGLKYNLRDNRTSSDTYLFTNLAGGNDTVTSTPVSNKRTQLELAADYRWNRRHGIRLAYERDDFKRWCNSYAITGNNPLGAGCVVSPANKEDKLGLGYRWSASDTVKFNAGYTHARRKSDFDHNAVTPVGVSSGVMGVVNGADFAGFIPYFEASRTQNIVKAGVSWKATEQLSLALNGRYAKDKYGDSPLGVQDGRSQGLNLDATYNYSEQDTIGAYFSWQNRERNLKSAETAAAATTSKTSYALLLAQPAVGIWSNRLKDDGNSLGINATRKGLMGGRLDLAGDVSYSIDKTAYSTQVPYSATCSTATVMTCGDFPTISNKVLRLKVGGVYQLDRNSQVALRYVFERRTSDDYYYNGYAFGFTPYRVTPTGEQAPNYTVNMVAASYIYSFR